MAEIRLPQLGESVTEGTITQWFKAVGESVALDEVLFEVSTDKVDSEVPSPVAGVVTQILVPEGETVDVGTVLAVIGDAATSPAPAVDVPSSEESMPVAEAVTAPSSQPDPVEAPESPPPASPAAGLVLSPIVRRLIEEHDLNPETILGTGVGGRITREDVLAVVDRQAQQETSAEAPTPVAVPVVDPAPAAPSAAPIRQPNLTEQGSAVSAIPLTNIRRITGEHMVESKAISPHVITAIEVDYERVEAARLPARAQFKATEGFSLTYLPFITRAVVDAIASFPHLNASLGPDDLIVSRSVNMAYAVDLNYEGLLAPVVSDTHRLSLRDIARAIHDVADRARHKRLLPDDLAGGTFTISNSGAWGTMFVAPIINQPQVAILSTDGIARRPVVVTTEYGDEAIAIHSVGVLTLSWDHRAFDGAYAASFLQRVKQLLETTDWVAELAR